ncbi:MAG: aspartate/glutamate racemase family protein [Treponema sp.]|jgi:allantoin racemase|nr:aspartate/glutamate racemase family protein [Treponema sp.]
MKLLVINPNTSAGMTEDIRQTIERIKSPGVQVTVTSPDFGARSLESFYDYTLAGFAICRLLDTARGDYDGVLIACYGDPGLYAAKEICACPVLGIAEASISLSLLLGSRFAILAASEKAVPMMENMISQYDVRGRFAGVLPLGMSVLDAEKHKQQTIERLIEAGGKAAANGAEVLILGCAGMTGMKEAVAGALNVVVLDPVECSYQMLEMICRCGYKVSKRGLYAPPAVKEIVRKELLGR